MLMTWSNFHPLLSLASSMAGLIALVVALILLLALWIDRRFGEPPAWVHPVVWMGRYLQACGSITVRCPPALAFVSGALAWWLGAMLTGALAWGLQALAFWQVANH
ncbi:MAG: cobalamin biosynthesis protein, partial [Lysobacterales bacterium]